MHEINSFEVDKVNLNKYYYFPRRGNGKQYSHAGN